MQVSIKITLNEPLSLPVNYQYLLQSIIYKSISIMPQYSKFLHDEGFLRGQRRYRLFQFSHLEGKYVLKNKRIIFTESISFEVRSPEPLFIRLFVKSIQEKGIRFLDTIYHDVDLLITDETVESDQIIIKMKTPITVYETDLITKKQTFYCPADIRFYELLLHNFYRKYEAYYGVFPKSYIEIQPLDSQLPKKMVTKYKEHYLTGWYGTFSIKGERKYLDFLYQSGLGSKNSQGFGMFEIIE